MKERRKSEKGQTKYKNVFDKSQTREVKSMKHVPVWHLAFSI